MKSVNDELNTYMNNEKHFETCDLFKLTLVNGMIFYLANYDVDVNYNAHVWEHNKGIITRTATKLSGEPTVDTMTVTIASDADDLLGTVSILEAVHQGLFDQGNLAMYKAYFDNGTCVGAYEIFEGRTEVDKVGGIKVTITVKSIIQGLSQNIPVRSFAPQEAYANVNGTITTSSTDTTSMLIPLKPSSRVLIKL